MSHQPRRAQDRHTLASDSSSQSQPQASRATKTAPRWTWGSLGVLLLFLIGMQGGLNHIVSALAAPLTHQNSDFGSSDIEDDPEPSEQTASSQASAASPGAQPTNLYMTREPVAVDPSPTSSGGSSGGSYVEWSPYTGINPGTIEGTVVTPTPAPAGTQLPPSTPTTAPPATATPVPSPTATADPNASPTPLPTATATPSLVRAEPGSMVQLSVLGASDVDSYTYKTGTGSGPTPAPTAYITESYATVMPVRTTRPVYPGPRSVAGSANSSTAASKATRSRVTTRDTSSGQPNGTVSDQLKYQWSGAGGASGTSSSAVVTAPAVEGQSITVTCVVDDNPPAITAPDTGSRDDAPQTITITVVGYHSPPYDGGGGTNGGGTNGGTTVGGTNGGGTNGGGTNGGGINGGDTTAGGTTGGTTTAGDAHPVQDTDVDNDGIPNWEDPDVDDDGLPNENDSDADNDGIPNDQDDTPLGPGPTKVWSPDTPIGEDEDGSQNGRILAPQDQRGPASSWQTQDIYVSTGTTIACVVEKATDWDKWTSSDDTSGRAEDSVTYQWSGGGTFRDSTAASTEWTAPSQEDDFTLTCTIRDGAPPIASDETGSRDDADVERQVTVHVVEGPKVTFDGELTIAHVLRACAGGIDDHKVADPQYRAHTRFVSAHAKVNGNPAPNTAIQFKFSGNKGHDYGQGSTDIKKAKLLESEDPTVWTETLSRSTSNDTQAQVALTIKSGDVINQPALEAHWTSTQGKDVIVGSLPCDFAAPESKRNFVDKFGVDEDDNGWLFYPPELNDDPSAQARATYLVNQGDTLPATLYMKFKVDNAKEDTPANWQYVNSHDMSLSVHCVKLLSPADPTFNSADPADLTQALQDGNSDPNATEAMQNLANATYGSGLTPGIGYDEEDADEDDEDIDYILITDPQKLLEYIKFLGNVSVFSGVTQANGSIQTTIIGQEKISDAVGFELDAQDKTVWSN